MSLEDIKAQAAATGAASGTNIRANVRANIAKLRRRLKETVDQGYFAGVTACAMQGGALLHSDAYGFADVEDKIPMRADTICRIASSTKPIIGVAMMILHEAGKWSLTDRLDRHIPQFAGLKVRGRDGALVDQIQPMTMAQIMSHSAGFGRGFGGPANADAPLQRPRDLQAMIDAMAAGALAYQPGKKWVYGPSVDIQGYIVERLSGQPLDDFLRERVFDKLGMKDTGFCVAPEGASRVASMYKYEGGALSRIARPDREQVVRRPSFLSGGGGLFSTNEDYRRFCLMLLNEGAYEGGRLLRPETVRLMRKDALEPQVYVSAVPGYILPGARFGLDFAVIAEPKGDNAMYGEGSYTWGGAFGTYFWIDPTNDLFVSGMVQIQNGGAQHLGMKTEYPDLKRESAQLLYWGERR